MVATHAYIELHLGCIYVVFDAKCFLCIRFAQSQWRELYKAWSSMCVLFRTKKARHFVCALPILQCGAYFMSTRAPK